jgi:hypothetical protein
MAQTCLQTLAQAFACAHKVEQTKMSRQTKSKNTKATRHWVAFIFKTVFIKEFIL